MYSDDGFTLMMMPVVSLDQCRNLGYICVFYVCDINESIYIERDMMSNNLDLVNLLLTGQSTFFHQFIVWANMRNNVINVYLYIIKNDHTFQVHNCY
jgi:hypothetical protein